MIAERPDVALIWAWLEDVPDPEIPAVSIVDLGIVRDVVWTERAGEAAALVVTVTPTYSGCPATHVIARDIVRALRDRGLARVRLETRLSPAWTTEWMSEAGRAKLNAYGIAPPAPGPVALSLDGDAAETIRCPRCASGDVASVSRYGSTPCKALFRCRTCQEPFDHFKCH